MFIWGISRYVDHQLPLAPPPDDDPPLNDELLLDDDELLLNDELLLDDELLLSTTLGKMTVSVRS